MLRKFNQNQEGRETRRAVSCNFTMPKSSSTKIRLKASSCTLCKLNFLANIFFFSLRSIMSLSIDVTLLTYGACENIPDSSDDSCCQMLFVIQILPRHCALVVTNAIKLKACSVVHETNFSLIDE